MGAPAIAKALRSLWAGARLTTGPPVHQSLLVYMLFLLVPLLASYGDASCHGHAYRLQSAIKQELHSRAFLAITRSEELWPWMAHVLLPYVHGNQSSPELGPPRLRQVRLQEALCPDPPGPRVHTCSAAGGFSTSDYDVGWESPHNGSGTWAYSAPDLLGAWSWGSCAVYDSGGYVQELGLSLEESRDRLRFLQLHNWLDNRSRAVFVELTRYSPAVGLHAAVTLPPRVPSGRPCPGRPQRAPLCNAPPQRGPLAATTHLGVPAAIRAALRRGRGPYLAQGRALARAAAQSLGTVAAGGADGGHGTGTPRPAGCRRPPVDPLRARPPAPVH
ncbi:polycystin-1-like isoform X3 [Nomascus leucogenys]|uniref:polycystin-1-like isoform X3 n=1 Tax=Nomascus leucogenys TaxID=61853 RepID=UPI00122DA4B6|nr:polycystin-1-like isoform X3 [Nomascus leucogenys]